ncbi:enoyl-CoA hydratase-related protein [Pelagibacteraceae bacterium]|jgi:enoyl-CoA hydratase|nr:enoyl-CoA hydratase-related protein [Pelagibacteraceae bacterium]|tara:strand:+ start:482 stop:1336 length:855 start_codon:yes stop_codon:yes gene_type:complete
MSKPFDVEINNSIAHIRFNRPEKRNSMNEDFWTMFPKEVEELDDSGEIRALIVSSTGPHFSAGIDLSMFKDDIVENETDNEMGRSRGYFLQQLRFLQNAVSCLEAARFPVVTAVQGGCIGGGIDLITAADIRICTKDAFFLIEEINVGLAADIGTIQRLPKIIPAGIAREWTMLGEKVSADRAKEVGLVSSLHDNHEEMMKNAFEIAEKLASKTPLAMWVTKETLNYSRDHTVKESLENVALWNAATLHKEDVMSTMMSKMQKKKPEYRNLRDKNFLKHKANKN